MIKFNIKDNIRQFTKNLKHQYLNQVSYTTSRTINELILNCKDEVCKQIPNIFDNKKTWWLNKDTGILKTNSNKHKLIGTVYLGNRNYFAHIQEIGGIRKPTKNKLSKLYI